jgi:hypothetical protein
MQRAHTYVALDQILAADLNADQDNAAPVAPLTGWRLGGELRAPGDGNIYIAPRRVILNANGVDTLVQTTETTWTPTTSASTWYYMYSTISGTTETLEQTTAAPDAALIYRNGVPSRRYLGCFRTTGANVILPFRTARGRCIYRWSKLALSNFTAVNAQTQAAYTTQSLAAFVPPHARIVQLELLLNARTNASAMAVRTNGDSTATSADVIGTNTGAAAAHALRSRIEMECDSSNQIQYICPDTGSGTAETTSIYVLGFTDAAN